MIENEERNKLMDEELRFTVPFGQVLIFIRFIKGVDGYTGSKGDTHFCFVQYFEVLRENDLRGH